MNNTLNIPKVISHRCKIDFPNIDLDISYLDKMEILHSMGIETEIDVDSYYYSDRNQTITFGHKNEKKEVYPLDVLKEYQSDKIYFHCKDLILYSYLHRYIKFKCFMNEADVFSPISNSNLIWMYEYDSDMLMDSLIRLDISDILTPAYHKLIIMIPGRLEEYFKVQHNGENKLNEFYEQLIKNKWIYGICTDFPIEVNLQLRKQYHKEEGKVK